ncbi:MAG TPA: xylose isomerase, partial [Candidatus Hydrogenedentes bacterium]|nr:xylose isomerase [Candidatus Hydrogenedentota bacterium]
AGHTLHHELAYAGANGILGSVDANRGDELLGWDTDQFPTNIYDTALAMYIITRYGGFKTGGLNFDAKIRRQSTDPVDLFYAHIGAMDAFARGLKIAARLLKDKALDNFIKRRYAGWDTGIGKKIENRAVTFEDLEAYTLKKGEPEVPSGRQELLENIINDYIC